MIRIATKCENKLQDEIDYISYEVGKCTQTKKQ